MPSPRQKELASSPLAASTDMNQRKIQELEQDLSADQRQSQQAQQARNNTPNCIRRIQCQFHRQRPPPTPQNSWRRVSCYAVPQPPRRPEPPRPHRGRGKGDGLQSPVLLKPASPPMAALRTHLAEFLAPGAGDNCPGSLFELTADGSYAGRRCACRGCQQACAGGERQLRARPTLCRLRGNDH